MRSLLKRQKEALVIVAHPDDETLFFGGLILTQKKVPWRVIAITDGGADGRADERMSEFQKACAALGVKNFEEWKFQDEFQTRLPIAALVEKLKTLPRPRVVYTHGPLGEYGHKHHQDVSRAVHEVFQKKTPVWSPAYNAYPEKVIRLSLPVWEKKLKILTEIYFKELSRFLHLLPATSSEGFVRAKYSEVLSIYDSLTTGAPLPEEGKLRVYRKLRNFLSKAKYGMGERLF